MIALMALAVPAEAAPQRIVSLNICTDELLLRLAEPPRIASVTWLSRDPMASNVATLAARVPVNHGSAEEVIPSAPDLVLVGAYTTPAATALLRRTGFRVAEFGIARSFDDVTRQIADAGQLFGSEARARELNADIATGMAAFAPPLGRRPRALVYNPNGLTVGKDTLADAVMRFSGLDNVAAQVDFGNYAQLPLELLASLKLDVLVVDNDGGAGRSLATDLLHHPVLKQLARTMRIVELPGRLWGCPGPGIVEAVARLRAVAEDLRDLPRVEGEMMH
jgi:iron complex transport system substrate-binding protein